MRLLFSSFPKLALTLGVAGLLAGFAASYLITPQYVSKASVKIAPVTTGGDPHDLQLLMRDRALRMEQHIMSRPEFAAKRGQIRIYFLALPAALGESAWLFDIACTDPNPGTAQQTVDALVSAFRSDAAGDRNIALDVLDAPSLPSSPVTPERSKIGRIGCIAGLLTACLIAAVRRFRSARSSRAAANG